MGQLDDRTLEELEGELRERAAARDAELLTGIASDGKHVVAFVRLQNGVGRSGVVLIHACASDRHCAYESLLAEDAERPTRPLGLRIRAFGGGRRAAIDGPSRLT